MSPREPRRGRSKEVSIRQRIRYRFDNVLARGTGAALVWLGVVTIAAVLLSSLLLTIFGVTFTGTGSSGWLEDFWQSLLRILDTGTMAGDIGWGRRVLALLVTLFGVLVAGTLIGIIAAGVEDRIDSMRRGRSVVIESGHLVILGGSRRLPMVVEQLVLANAERESNTIVILADRDPTDMRRAVVEAVPDRHGTHIVYRSGDPTLRSDLALARVGDARGAIVLSDDDDRSDVAVVQTVLAINAELGDLGDLTVVAEVNDPATAARLVDACGPTVHPIVTAQAIARTAAFALRQRGLGEVVAELADFRGCDLHIAEQPALTGLRFDELVGRFANARPLGVVHADGRIALNPPADSIVADGDRLVVIAQDLETLELAEATSRLPNDAPIRHRAPLATEAATEHILVMGWNRLGPHLLNGWAATTSASSTVEVVFDPQLIEPSDIIVPDLGVDVRLSPASELSSLSFARRPTTIVMLGSTTVDPSEADTRTLLDVMQLRRRWATQDETPRFIVQMLDDEHLELAELSGPDDFLISAALGSQFIAQLIEQPERRGVLLELYGGDHASIRLVRCGRLDLVGSFTADQIFSGAYAAGVLAIGWRHATIQGEQVMLNPNASDRVTLAADDEIVIVG